MRPNVCTCRDECRKRQGRREGEREREKESIKAFTLPSKERAKGEEGENSRTEKAKDDDNEQEKLGEKEGDRQIQ